MYIILKGPFYSTQNSGHFGWYIKCNEPFRFGPTGIFGTSFEGGPLWPVRLSRSVGQKCPVLFDKMFVPSTALLYPAYKNNNQTGGGLSRVCATGMHRSIGLLKFLKFQTGIFVEWQAPKNSPWKTIQHSAKITNSITVKLPLFTKDTHNCP